MENLMRPLTPLEVQLFRLLKELLNESGYTDSGEHWYVDQCGGCVVKKAKALIAQVYGL